MNDPYFWGPLGLVAIAIFAIVISWPRPQPTDETAAERAANKWVNWTDVPLALIWPALGAYFYNFVARHVPGPTWLAFSLAALWLVLSIVVILRIRQALIRKYVEKA